VFHRVVTPFVPTHGGRAGANGSDLAKVHSSTFSNNSSSSFFKRLLEVITRSPMNPKRVPARLLELTVQLQNWYLNVDHFLAVPYEFYGEHGYMLNIQFAIGLY
jgi:hypothetical protein